MVPEIGYTAPQEVIDAIGALERTEDVRFSPSNRRLAVASFFRNRIAVFDVDIASSRGAATVALTGGVELSSPALRWPHGVDFIDDDTLIVTSRASDVALFRLPSGKREMWSHDTAPLARWPADDTTSLDAPGSVVVTPVEPGLCEVLICNNSGHTVTRHLVNRGGGELKHSEILLRSHLEVPDGVSVSPDRRWIAVSNHSTHNVLLYEGSPALGPEADPDGVLRRVHYPHGLRFSGDGRHLFVADAGAPYLHVYAQGPDEWRGVRDPVGSVRIMEDAIFERSRHNIEEGGPKGLDIDAHSQVLAVTSEGQPLAFFEVAALLQRASADGSIREASVLGIRYEVSLMRERRRVRERARDEIDALRNSRSWRITAPLRRLSAAMRRRASRPRPDAPGARYESPEGADA
jgi:hypothetical protein